MRGDKLMKSLKRLDGRLAAGRSGRGRRRAARLAASPGRGERESQPPPSGSRRSTRQQRPQPAAPGGARGGTRRAARRAAAPTRLRGRAGRSRVSRSARCRAHARSGGRRPTGSVRRSRLLAASAQPASARLPSRQQRPRSRRARTGWRHPPPVCKQTSYARVAPAAGHPLPGAAAATAAGAAGTAGAATGEGGATDVRRQRRTNVADARTGAWRMARGSTATGGGGAA